MGYRMWTWLRPPLDRTRTRQLAFSLQSTCQTTDRPVPNQAAGLRGWYAVISDRSGWGVAKLLYSWAIASIFGSLAVWSLRRARTGIFTARHARRGTCTDKTVSCLGGGGAAQLCGRRCLAPELSSPVGLGRCHRERTDPVRERQHDESFADSADWSRPLFSQNELITSLRRLRKFKTVVRGLAHDLSVRDSS